MYELRKPDFSNVDDGIHKFVHMVAAEIIDRFHAQQLQNSSARKFSSSSSNLSFGDRWAIQWLKTQTCFLDAPADKNLGTVIMKKQHYDELIRIQLNHSFQHALLRDVEDTVDRVTIKLRDQVNFAKDMKLVHEKQLEFLQCLAPKEQHRLPRVRGLIKIHKKVPAARLIVAQTRWVTTPLAVFLSVMLQAVCNTFNTVAKDTSDIVESLEAVRIDDSCKLHTFDVENLYGCIDQERASKVIRAALIRFYSTNPVNKWGALVEWLLALLSLVFEAQYCAYTFNGVTTWWYQHLGVSTGLPCGTQIANLFLEALDSSVMASFSRDIRLYKRYIDDLLIIASEVALGVLMQFLNQFDDHIKITHDTNDASNARSCSFLDLFIRIENGNSITYSTYRKPQCTYSYLPETSCHSRATKHGIIHTECIRMLRTNCAEDSFREQVNFFVGKLRDRGYDPIDIRRIVAKYDWSRKSEVLHKNADRKRLRVVPLKIRFSEDVQKLGIGRILSRYKELLPISFRQEYKIVTCFESGRNLFRLRYARFF